MKGKICSADSARRALGALQRAFYTSSRPLPAVRAPAVPALPSTGGIPLAPLPARVDSRVRHFRAERHLAAEEATGAAASSAKQKQLPPPSEPPQRRTIRAGPVTWASLALLVLTGLGLTWFYDTEKKKRIQGVRKEKVAGKAAIGGPFTLVDQTGKTVTEQDFKGAWNLIYFGFTFCPDICPAELTKMAAAVDLVEKKAGIQIRPIFITVDPERDSVEQVAQYVSDFHPRLVGLTGSPDATQHAAREFRVYFMKTDDEGDDYLVDHSIIMYLMDPNMEFVKFFGKNYEAEALAGGIVEQIKSWNEENK